ncbi:MAG TPA: alpha/beta hydrolase [Pseudonocardia sp.]|jgi:acetyl esterase|uniref:alpha/beta hydrolase n=1 Tax=Pseudonocardia sp. TaxID=60912 RepID=UPI002F3E28C8
MALDPQLHRVLELLRARGLVGFADMTVAQARAAILALTDFQGEPQPIAGFQDIPVPGPAGPLPTRVYRPAGSGAARRLPMIVYFHGGGFVLGNLELADRPCRALANASGALVASVEYRKAPEAPFPAAVLDCHAATDWLIEHAASLGGDPTRIGVAGDNVGANLAAVVAQRARGQRGPVLAVQLLMYPPVDFAGEWPSRAEHSEGYLLSTRDLDWFAEHYLGSDPEPDPADPRLSPLRAADLANLPPTMVVTAGHDPLRDEGRAYARALAQAGVFVRERHDETMVHGFCWLTGTVERAEEVLTELGDFARDIFATATAAPH